MNKFLRLLLILGCFVGFLYIRFRESAIFYDPLIDYYHGDYQNNPMPVMAEGKFYVNVLFKYVIHMMLSLIILWATFMDKQIVKFATLFYGILFIVLIIAMYVLMQQYDFRSHVSLFYVRRFLIQPLLIFLLLPAFFYSRKVNS